MAEEDLREGGPSRREGFVTDLMDELREVSDTGIQFLLRNVDQGDLVGALQGASEEVREKVLSNVSERVRTFLEDEMVALAPAHEEEVRRAQEVVMGHLREIRHPPGERDKEYEARRRDLATRLRAKSVSRFGCEGLAQLFCDMAAIAATEGLLGLEEAYLIVYEDEEDKLLGLGLNQAIGLVPAAETSVLLEKRMRLLLREQETRYRMIIEGVALLREGMPEGAVQFQLRAHYTLDGA